MTEELENSIFVKQDFNLVQLTNEVKQQFPKLVGLSDNSDGNVIAHFLIKDAPTIAQKNSIKTIIDNHVAVAPRDFKAEIAAAFTDSEKLNIALEKMGLK